VYKYRMVLSWSEPDQVWVVDVPELPGCFADGATPEEAVANAQLVITEWMETARRYGQPIPEPQPYDVPASA
jgi:predicted RNase H-like HicB family nuclease